VIFDEILDEAIHEGQGQGKICHDFLDRDLSTLEVIN